jgi:hypothetical protein
MNDNENNDYPFDGETPLGILIDGGNDEFADAEERDREEMDGNDPNEIDDPEEEYDCLGDEL